MTADDIREREECVFSALETGLRLRGHEAGANASGGLRSAAERMISVIEAETARIQAHDLSAVEAVFASRALAPGYAVLSARTGLCVRPGAMA